MIFLFILFFILELFLAVNVAIWLYKLDVKVNNLTEKIKVNRNNFKVKLRIIRDDVDKIRHKILRRKKAIEVNKKVYKFNLIKNALTTLLIFIAGSGKKHQKKLLMLELIFIIKDLCKNIFKIKKEQSLSRRYYVVNYPNRTCVL